MKTDRATLFPMSDGDLAQYHGPFGQYDHTEGNAISGGYVYKGSLRDLKDKYFFGDIVTGRLFYMNIDENLSDSTVYEVTIVQNGKETNLKELIGTSRVHLRIGYDSYADQLFVMSKVDGKVRRISNAYFDQPAL